MKVIQDLNQLDPGLVVITLEVCKNRWGQMAQASALDLLTLCWDMGQRTSRRDTTRMIHEADPRPLLVKSAIPCYTMVPYTFDETTGRMLNATMWGNSILGNDSTFIMGFEQRQAASRRT